MPGTREDVRRLLEFSLRSPLRLALQLFPMFTPKQIRAVYALGGGQRKQLLAHRQSDEFFPHAVVPPRSHRDYAQAEKMKEQATDPSNR